MSAMRFKTKKDAQDKINDMYGYKKLEAVRIFGSDEHNNEIEYWIVVEGNRTLMSSGFVI